MKENIIALIFDFDITLSPDFQQQVLFDKWNIQASDFWKIADKHIEDGYDMEHAYLKALIELGRSDEKYALTNEDLFEYGKQVKLYDGLSKANNAHSIFDDLNEILNDDKYQEHNIKLECYCISGGITDMINGSLQENKLDTHFKEVFDCSLDIDETGKLGFIKETVGHTIKTQKIYMIAKGVSIKNGDNISKVNEVTDSLRIPFENMIFLGDGQTDIPAFSLINSKGGTSIAVYREEKNDDGSINEAKTLKTYNNGYNLAVKSKRAEQILPADYGSGKPLKMALLGYVNSLAENIVNNS